LRTQILPLEAVALESNKFGQYYESRGALTGPNGGMLAVRAIWMAEHLSGVTKFVTLIPDKRRA
jgi:cysteine synthase